MALDCHIVRDILPLYAENMVSERTKTDIEEHIDSCKDCRTELERIGSSAGEQVQINIESAAPLKTLKRRIRRHSAIIATVTALIAVTITSLLAGIFIMQPGDEMAFSLLVMYIAVPLTGLICAAVLTAGKRTKAVGLVMPLLFGAADVIIATAVYGNGDVFSFMLAAVPTAFGAVLGLLTGYIRSKKQ